MRRGKVTRSVRPFVFDKASMDAVRCVLAPLSDEIVRAINGVVNALDRNRDGLSKVGINGFRLRQFNRLRELNAGGMSVYTGCGVVLAELPGTVENGGYVTRMQIYSYAHLKRDHFRWD